MTSGKVLLVDDEKELPSVLSQRLETRGRTVQSAANGKEARSQKAILIEQPA